MKQVYASLVNSSDAPSVCFCAFIYTDTFYKIKLASVINI